MLKRKKIVGTTSVRVSFILPADDPRLPAAVVGDFNDWDETADPLRRRSNGTASAVVLLESGVPYRFRYCGAGGHWFDDDMADGYEPNVHGSSDCIVVP
jgi:1,4-alpha-glucan branching enzyme